ncbi:MAG: hypothetical protein GY722_13320 [bacterium]|nr:hypothetical protein [bacterium]
MSGRASRAGVWVLVALAATVIGAAFWAQFFVMGDLGFTITITNPCPTEIEIETWDDHDPGRQDSLTHPDRRSIPGNSELRISSIGEDFEVVVAIDRIDWSERQAAPEPGGTISFYVPLAACPGADTRSG